MCLSAARVFILIGSAIRCCSIRMCVEMENEYTRDELDRQLKTEFISALQPAFGRLSELELRPNQIVTHNTDLEDAMNETLSAKWGELR